MSARCDALLNLGTLTLECPSVMGILNLTPDSFSDGGKYAERDRALQQAQAMLAAGAHIIDVGGESTRPGASDVSTGEELDRVIPLIEALRSITGAPISVDTSKAVVMREAVAAGASMINDVLALQEPGTLDVAAELAVPVCLMHMQGRPRTMQEAPVYDDVVADVTAFLRQRIQCCIDAGIAEESIVVDPGFGFGKTPAHNLQLLANLQALAVLGRPILAGLSRKSTLGKLTGRSVQDRLAASIAAQSLALANGAAIIRAHDVAEAIDAVRVVSAVLAVKDKE